MPQHRLRLVLAPTSEDVSRAGAALRAMLDACCGPGSHCHDIELGVAEALANVVRHGSRRTFIALRCTCGPAGVRVLAADDGNPADMTKLPAALPADPLAGSGRGLWIIARTVDAFRYRRFRSLNVHCLERRAACAR